VEVISSLKRFMRGDEGQDLLEYALLVALIALVAVAAITLTGTIRQSDFQQHRCRARAAGQLDDCSRSVRRGERRWLRLSLCEEGKPMVQMITAIGRLALRDEGQDLMEYGLLAALIAIVAVAGVTVLGQTIFTDLLAEHWPGHLISSCSRWSRLAPEAAPPSTCGRAACPTR
jgi:Flp pilus assembly pilin Flp